MKISNTTRSDIGLQPGIIVPAGGSLDIDNEALSRAKSLPSVKAHFIEGRLTEDGAVGAPDDKAQESNPDRAAIVSGIIRSLSDEDFTKGGKPEVDAINTLMPESADPVTAAERDAAWEGMDG